MEEWIARRRVAGTPSGETGMKGVTASQHDERSGEFGRGWAGGS